MLKKGGGARRIQCVALCGECNGATMVLVAVCALLSVSPSSSPNENMFYHRTKKFFLSTEKLASVAIVAR